MTETVRFDSLTMALPNHIDRWAALVEGGTFASFVTLHYERRRPSERINIQQFIVGGAFAAGHSWLAWVRRKLQYGGEAALLVADLEISDERMEPAAYRPALVVYWQDLNRQAARVRMYARVEGAVKWDAEVGYDNSAAPFLQAMPDLFGGELACTVKRAGNNVGEAYEDFRARTGGTWDDFLGVEATV